ncbi:MAG: SDR family oxidoreductase [Azonexus sp.]|jgi:NAD(P)-dependent dehydrogenase (short-subunit alcohol dehydrogenase family)|nr:SDR family oxidoreductase [Azonexus sp.]
MQKLAGKTALITGGTSGIGLATAQLMQREGTRVAVSGRSPSSLTAARTRLGPDALVLDSDSSKLSAIDHLVQTMGNAFGHLDILVLNAGIATPGPMETVSEHAFDEMVSVNFKGIFFTLQRLSPLLTSGSSVILTTSITNRLGSPNFSVYAACKAALRSLTTSLALELIPRGIRVNAVSPGPVSTPMFDRMGLPPEISQSLQSEIASKSPSQRFGTPDELAKAIVFLASNDASYIIGHELVVDGGMSLL